VFLFSGGAGTPRQERLEDLHAAAVHTVHIPDEDDGESFIKTKAVIVWGMEP
jgi:hypothetical protein